MIIEVRNVWNGHTQGQAAQTYQELSAPLFSHRIGNSRHCAASFFPSIRRRSLAPNSSMATFNDVCRDQFRQTFQPNTGCFGFSVPKHPRLNDLIWLTKLSAQNPNRIFPGNTGNSGPFHQPPKCLDISFLSISFFFEPPRSTYGHVGTRPEENHCVPVGIVVQQFKQITLDVWSWYFCRNQVARNGVMASFSERFSNDTTKLTTDQNTHEQKGSKWNITCQINNREM